MRIVLGEDNFLVREGVRRLLEDGDDVEVVAQAATGTELTALVEAHRPDAVLTDIRMPPRYGTEGIDAALAIRTRAPAIGVVVLSQHADAAYARMLFRDGTAGLAYLLKERVADRDELLRALTAVSTGGAVIDPQIVEALMASGRHREASPLRDLTPRELEVLREMANGSTNAAIAATLFVSESAVSKHISAIFGKLGLPKTNSSTAEFAPYLPTSPPVAEDRGPGRAPRTVR